MNMWQNATVTVTPREGCNGLVDYSAWSDAGRRNGALP